MDISNKLTYYMNVMTAFVVNTNSADDPSGDIKRVQIYIPSIQIELKSDYKSYINSSNKKDSEHYRKFPWAYNTVSDLNDNDLVYVSSINNTNGEYLIIGKDVSCFQKSGIGGGDDGLDASGLAELIIPFIIHHECGVHNNLPTDHTKNKFKPTTKSHGNIYECVGWDSEVPDTAYACYVTSTSNSASVGLFNWDSSRGYDILVQVAKKESNWSSYWNTSYDLYKEIKSNVEGTKSSKSTGISLFRTSQEEVIYSIQKMLTSSTGKEVQNSQARVDATGYIQWVMDKGATNIAILLFVADTINQYGKPLSKLYDAAVNPSSVSVDDNKLNSTMNTYENKSSMMEEFERVVQWFLDTYEPELQTKDTSRRKDCVAYIRELYKQGKLAKFSAGLTMIGDLPANKYRDITIVSPLKDEIVTAYQTDYFNGTLHHEYKAHQINTYFGSYKTMYQNGKLKPHAGVDFHINNGELYYASHDGTMTISDSGGNGSGYGYGYCAKIKFTEAGHNWTIIYGHMDRQLSPQYFKIGTYEIKAGQVIGVGDSTGNSTGPHLHYEIQMDGTPINPLLFLGMGNAVTTFYPNQQLNE